MVGSVVAASTLGEALLLLTAAECRVLALALTGVDEVHAVVVLDIACPLVGRGLVRE